MHPIRLFPMSPRSAPGAGAALLLAALGSAGKASVAGLAAHAARATEHFAGSSRSVHPGRVDQKRLRTSFSCVCGTSSNAAEP